MKRLEDDIYSFGFILLEALVGPSVSSQKEAILPNVMVCICLSCLIYKMKKMGKKIRQKKIQLRS